MKNLVTWEKWWDRHAIHAPVGFFKMNPFGLYDMVGNLREWCEDPYVFEANQRKVQLDGRRRFLPEDLKQAPLRVMRGSSWSNNAGIGRSAARFGVLPSDRGASMGTRAARRVTGKR